MTESEALLIRNILNGVPPSTAAIAAGLSEEDGLAAFHEAMQRVAEYRTIHCLPLFMCNTVAAAQGSRLMVMEALNDIVRWDTTDRDVVAMLLRGQKPQIASEEGARILRRTLRAIPFYMNQPSEEAVGRDIAVYQAAMSAYEKKNNWTPMREYIRANRGRLLAILERFVSFREPLLLKNITHQTIVAEPQ